MGWLCACKLYWHMDTAPKSVELSLLDGPVAHAALGLHMPLLPAPAQEQGAAVATSEPVDIALPAEPHDHPAIARIPEALALPEHLRHIAFRLELRVPLPRFTLRSLQTLESGALLQTDHAATRDLVLTAAGERLLLVELEAAEEQLTARVKRLA